MKSILIPFLLIFTLFSCKKENKVNILAFKEGRFKTHLEDSNEISTFVRIGNYQYETYRQKTDTFKVIWKNNFEYQLLKINPKTRLDSTPFVVKITAIKANAYEFKGAFVGSNFKQNGISYLLP